jgi:choline dehydrogenase-like flavoprotein
MVAPVNERDRVVVIGSGPPGATAALFLCRAGVEVLLLEAGPKNAALGLTLRVRGVTLAKLKRPLNGRSGVTKTADPDAALFEDLSPGGLSNHWSCAVPRFSREDFEDAERAGEEYRWPLGYDDLAPYYDRVEPLLHVAGSTADVPQLPAGKVRHAWKIPRSWRPIADDAPRLGRSVVPMPYAYGADTTLTLSGTPFNSFVRLIKPARRTGKLSLRCNARALRLDWSAAEKRVEAVTYLDATTGREEQVRCRAVVVAAGAINTPQILLQSVSSDFPEGLGNVHGVLGRYLHDHPVGKLMIDLKEPMSIHPAAYLTRLPLDRSKPLYAAACMQWSGASMIAKSVLAGHPGRLPSIGFSVFGTMIPTKNDWVIPDVARPAGTALKLNVHHPPECKQVLDEARDQMLELLERAGYAPRERVWKIETAGNSNHYGGTCRMHADPHFGMLDAWSRMHAAPNVMVADSAAFTTGPEKNPVLTAMALAARGSERLAADLKADRV